MDAKTNAIEHEFDFIGENLALDFANTWGGLPPDSPSQERLDTYARLVAWSQQAQIIKLNTAQILLDKAEGNQAEASAILERAISLREAMREIFLALAKAQPPSKNDLALFNRELEQAMMGAQLLVTAEGFDWEWRKKADALDQMLAPLVRSAATLLTSTERQLVRKCGNPQCRWLFVDTTKNHRRQWCKTSGCGNLMRVRKHRERQRDVEKSDL